MIKFGNQLQLIKFEVLREVAKAAMNNNLEDEYEKIPEKIIPGPKPRNRCCIYNERAIIKDRVALAMGGDKENKNIIEILPSACDACPINRFTITEACRGCLAHRCSEACPVDAIFHVGQRAYINQEKCVECGRCRDACQYNAVSDVLRPCRGACPTKALTLDKDKLVVIDDELCIQCGACITRCPFGAIDDKSYIVDIIDLIKKSDNNKNYKVYAAVAPSIASQFKTVKLGQVIGAIKKLGFHDVVEVALGADITAYHETQEFAEEIKEKKFITSSCCPAFVAHVQKMYPELSEHISTTISPMITISRLLKHEDENAKVVFIGPCMAKKAEIQQEDLAGSTDYVMTFEEMYAMFEASEINLEECEEEKFEGASLFGRIFARSGGLSEAISHVIEKENLKLDFNPIRCDGIKECDKTLKIAKVNRLQENFIEGMACKGGCIGGAAALKVEKTDRKKVDDYGKLSIDKGIKDSIEKYKEYKINMHRKDMKKGSN
ncbi:4Fe-4S dicluster domain-containing protein [Lutibacter sp. B2]|nr:4Fe-4S dicluster domain-containing protein [Lutibacter sp. B2]